MSQKYLVLKDFYKAIIKLNFENLNLINFFECVIAIKVDKAKFEVCLIPCLACSKHVLISKELWVSNLAIRLKNLKSF